MAHDVFISYSTKDKLIADAVCARLEQNKIRCWIASRDITPGANWPAAIVDAIDHARIMILVFSSSANESPQIVREVTQAHRQGVITIPFRIEDVLPANALRYFLDATNWLDAMTSPMEAHLDRLAGTVKVLLDHDSNVIVNDPPVRIEPPISHASKRWIGRIFAGLLVLGAIGVILTFLLMSKFHSVSPVKPDASSKIITNTPVSVPSSKEISTKGDEKVFDQTPMEEKGLQIPKKELMSASISSPTKKSQENRSEAPKFRENGSVQKTPEVVKISQVSPQRCYAVVPVEFLSKELTGDADAFYQAIIEKLVRVPDIRVLERQELKTVLTEADLAGSFDREDRIKKYSSVSSQLAATDVLIPILCKVENDYILGLRHFVLPEDKNMVYAVRKTRLISDFPALAESLVAEVVDIGKNKKQSANGSKTTLDTLRQECLAVGANQLFSSLWERAENLYEKAAADQIDAIGYYYISLLENTNRAKSPPAGMVFIPGGWVQIDVESKGKKEQRQYWLEPFFIDRYEVSVRDYAVFLQAQQNADGMVSIVEKDPLFNKPEYPVTGISWEAANAYARWKNKELPTAIQWIRAAVGETLNLYPCGDSTQLRQCNLTGEGDGYRILSPVNLPKGDASFYGLLNMTGNVREWTRTWFIRNVYEDCEGDVAVEPEDGVMKIIKGGSWRTGAKESECSGTEALRPGDKFDDVGFRCVQPFFEEKAR